MHEWPRELMLIRHGESAGNVARAAALRDDLADIDIAGRDCDVALSALGEQQSVALGTWLGAHWEAPDAVLSSPFERAVRTAALMREAAGWDAVPVRTDERLREKEFGMLDRLTRRGIEQRFPEQAAMRAALGKFYYRPPGGESWTDVLLRLHSFADTLRRDYAGKRVAVVSHQVVVLCLRYLIEGLDERRILAIDALGDVANCSITQYAGTELLRYNDTAPLDARATPVTAEPDVPVAPK